MRPAANIYEMTVAVPTNSHLRPRHNAIAREVTRLDLSAEVRDLYGRLLAEVEKFGPVVAEEKKTSIHLKHKTGFAGVHPSKSYYILNIVSAEPIQSTRIVKQERVSANRFHNEMRIEKSDDLDADVLAWLRSAYELMA